MKVGDYVYCTKTRIDENMNMVINQAGKLYKVLYLTDEVIIVEMEADGGYFEADVGYHYFFDYFLKKKSIVDKIDFLFSDHFCREFRKQKLEKLNENL